MSVIQALLGELEHEARTTRRMLERLPEGKFGWRPHERSMTLGQLALHVAQTPGGLASAAMQSPMQLPNFTQPQAASVSELVATHDASIATAKEIVAAIDEKRLGDLWRVVDGDREITAMPIGAVLRSLMLNHWYHHRGQLSVYMRELGVPVPSIYGPSADENPFAVAAA